MRRISTPATSFWSALVLLVLVTLPATLRAQSFSGTGQQATELFSLAEGLAVFEFNYEGKAQLGRRRCWRRPPNGECRRDR